MDFDQFKIQVVDEMRERFPDLDIGIQAVSKLQGESYTSLAVSPADSNVAATMNLDYVFKRVEDGMPMETALHNIEKQVAEIAGSMPQFDTRALMDYDQMKEKLTLQMIPIAGNEENLSEIPHRVVEDMIWLMRTPVLDKSIEFADNRISLFAAQYGRCTITGTELMPYDIRCHHKVPLENGGTDKYSNLVLVTEAVHLLIHATAEATIQKYLKTLQLNKKQLEKLNKLRELAGTPAIAQ